MDSWAASELSFHNTDFKLNSFHWKCLFIYLFILNQISSLQKNGRKQKGSSWGVLLAVAIGLKNVAHVSQLRLALRLGY